MDFQFSFPTESIAKAWEDGVIREKVLACYREIRAEIGVIRERDPAARSEAEVLLLYPGLHALLAYRLAHILHQHGYFMLARTVSQSARFLTGIEIHPCATIGKGLFIDHGCAVVIGETAEIGDNCTIYQGVTLGGTGKDVGKRHPTLGDNVMVGAGAKILGPVHIGNNVKIAAGAVVLKDIPDDSTAVGIPAKVVKSVDRKNVDSSLDQIHIPDPVAQQIAKLQAKIDDLEKELEAIKANEQ